MNQPEVLTSFFNQSQEAQQRLFLAGNPEIVGKVDAALGTLGKEDPLALGRFTAAIISNLPQRNGPRDQLRRQFTYSFLPRISRHIEGDSWKPVDAAFIEGLRSQPPATVASLTTLIDAGRVLAPYMGSNTQNPGEIRNALNEVAEREDVPENLRTSIDETNKALALVFIETHTGKRKIEKYSGPAFRFYQERLDERGTPTATAAEFYEQIKGLIPSDSNTKLIRQRQISYLAYLNPERLSLQQIGDITNATVNQVNSDLIRLEQNGLIDRWKTSIARRRQIEILEDLKARKGRKEISEKRGIPRTSVDRHIRALEDNGLFEVKNIVPRRRLVRQLYRLGLEYKQIAKTLKISRNDVHNDVRWLKVNNRVETRQRNVSHMSSQETSILKNKRLQAALGEKDPDPLTIQVVDRYLARQSNTSLADLTEDIIIGLVSTTERLNDAGLVAALKILDRIPFVRIPQDAWDEIKVVYAAGILASTKASDSNSRINELIAVSKIMAPYLMANLQNPAEVIHAWDPVRETTDTTVNKSGVTSAVEELITDLALQCIVILSTSDSSRTKANPDIIRRRQEVYKLFQSLQAEHRTAEKEAEILTQILKIQISTQTIYEDHSWLIARGLIERKIVTRDSRKEEAEQIKRDGLTNPNSELKQILILYLQGVPLSIIVQHYKNVAEKIKVLHDTGVIPMKYYIKGVRAYANDRSRHQRKYTDEEIANMVGIPIDNVKLILSVSPNPHALDGISPQGTIYEK